MAQNNYRNTKLLFLLLCAKQKYYLELERKNKNKNKKVVSGSWPTRATNGSHIASRNNCNNNNSSQQNNIVQRAMESGQWIRERALQKWLSTRQRNRNLHTRCPNTECEWVCECVCLLWVCVKLRLVSVSVGGHTLCHAYAIVMPILAKKLTIL